VGLADFAIGATAQRNLLMILSAISSHYAALGVPGTQSSYVARAMDQPNPA